MSCKEVSILRKNGQLDGALAMAKSDLEIERNEYSVSALFWVYRDLAIKEFDQKNMQNANIYLLEAKTLSQAPELKYDEFVKNAISSLIRKFDPNYCVVDQASEQSKQGDAKGAYNMMKKLLEKSTLNDSLHESYGWIIYRYLNNEYKALGSQSCRRILADYINLHNERPSMLHSNMLNLASKVSETYSDFKFLEFINLWGAENFKYEDFRPTEYQGKQYPSLTSRLMERCFRMDYGLENVIKAFTANSNIKESDVLEVFSRIHFFDIYSESTANGSGLYQLFKSYCSSIAGKTIQNTYHSKILKSIVYKSEQKHNADFLKLFDQWGESNFMPSDWEKETTEDGREFPSLVEKAISKYIDALKMTNQISKGSDEFVNLLKDSVAKFPENYQHKRFLAKLLFAKGNVYESLNLYKELLLTLNEYYVWAELSERIDNKLLAKSAICKALSRGSSEDYLGNLHLKLAEILVNENNYSAALTELNAYYSTYSKKQWKIGEEYDKLIVKIPEGIIASEDNHELYEQNKQDVEDYVYSSIEAQEYVVAEFYYNSKQQQRVLFVDGTNSFSVNPNAYSELKNCHIGQTYLVKINKIEKGNQQIIPLLFRLSNSVDWNPLPDKFGVIEYVNESKQVFHIISSNSEEVFYKYREREFQIGDYIIFKQYKINVHKEERNEITFVKHIEKSIALNKFPQRIIIVDDVNTQKELFHYVSEPFSFSGIVKFNQTRLRPLTGDFLKISYYTKLSKTGKRQIMILDVQPTEEELKGFKKSIKGRLVLNTNKEDWEYDFTPFHNHSEINENTNKENCECDFTSAYASIENFDWDKIDDDGDKYAADEKARLEYLYTKSFKSVDENAVILGKVVSINNREVVVNLGFKSEGVINASELRYNPELKLGDEIEVYVESQEDVNGRLVLSHKRALFLKSWQRINEAYKNQEIITGYVKGKTKGGLIVDVLGVEAFLPGSQIDIKPIYDYDGFIDTTIELKVLKINNDYRTVVVSHNTIYKSDNLAQVVKNVDVEDYEMTPLPDYGFVNDCYVHKCLLRKYNIVNNCNVIAHLVKNNEGRWKVYDLEVTN